MAVHDSTAEFWPGQIVTRIGEYPSSRAADEVLWYDVPAAVRTSHILTVQWDGWVVNPTAWDAAWLQYDYIGAPWWFPPQFNVGNGGVSLRSRRLMRFLADSRDRFPLKQKQPEDATLSREYRCALEGEGFCWAPQDVAWRFSRERTGWELPGRPFAMHGLYNWPRVLSAPQIGARMAHFNDYIVRRIEYGELLVAMHNCRP